MRHGSNIAAVSLLLIWGILGAFGTGSLAGESPYKSEGVIESIDRAADAGVITQGERLVYRLQAVMTPERLPAEFKTASQQLLKCGTSIVEEVVSNWETLTPEQQALAASYFARPSTESTYLSQSGHFLIHYNVTGSESVPLADDDLSLIPDYVERIGLFADSCRSFYHTGLGYLPVPPDGDGIYDIYLLRIGAYGLTVREGVGDSSWNDYSSYMQIHCNFDGFPENDDPAGRVIGAQKVTCAHEYYHAVQLAYDGLEDIWWMECTATFFEEVSYSEVNDNYNYLPYFYNYPDTSLTVSTGLHMYGSFVWPQFLTKKFGLNVQKSIWEYCRYHNSLTAIDSALAKIGSGMKPAFAEFAAWNYFTGFRHDTSFLDSGAYYPLVPLDQVIPSYPFSGITSLRPPDGLGASYLFSYVNAADNGLLRIDFDGANTVEWGFSYARFKNNSREIFYNVPIDYLGKTSAGVYDFVIYDSMLFVPAVVSQWQNNNQFSFSTVVCPFGDVNASGELNILDVTYLLGYIYKGGPAPKYDLKMGDMNCNGIINILDVSYLINHLYRTGAPPCLYRP
jgi:hypothetical protein